MSYLKHFDQSQDPPRDGRSADREDVSMGVDRLADPE